MLSHKHNYTWKFVTPVSLRESTLFATFLPDLERIVVCASFPENAHALLPHAGRGTVAGGPARPRRSAAGRVARGTQ